MGMYDKMKCQGKTLAEWAMALGNTFTVGELYRRMIRRKDFSELCGAK